MDSKRFFLESHHPSPWSVSPALAAPDLASSWDVPALMQPAGSVGAETENLMCSTSSHSPGAVLTLCLPPQSPQLQPHHRARGSSLCAGRPAVCMEKGRGNPLFLPGARIPPVGPEFSSQTINCAQNHPALPRLLPTTLPRTPEKPQLLSQQAQHSRSGC